MALRPTNASSPGVRWRWLVAGCLPALVVALLWWADPSPAPLGVHPSLAPDRPGAVRAAQVATAAVAALVLAGRAGLMRRRPAAAVRAYRDAARAWAVCALACALLAVALAAPAVLPGGRGAWWWAPDAGVMVLGLGMAASAHLAVRRVRGALAPHRALLDGLLVVGSLALLTGGPPHAPEGVAAGLAGGDRWWAALVAPQAPLAAVGLVVAAVVLARVAPTAAPAVAGVALLLLAVAGGLRLVAVLDPSRGVAAGGAAACLALALGWLAAAGLQPLPERVRAPHRWQGLVVRVLAPPLVLLLALVAVAAASARAASGGAHPSPALVLGVVLAAVVRQAAAARDAARTHDALVRTREELRESALSDPLTGAANRGALTRALQRALRRGGGHDVVVALLDVEGVADVNDRCGHAAGDAVLVAVADRIRSSVRGSDLVARWAGDEFAVLLLVPPGGAPDEDVPALLTHRLRMAFSVPVDVDPGAVGPGEERALAEAVEGLRVSTGVVAASELRVPGELPGEAAAVDADALLHAAGVLVRRARLTRTRDPRIPDPSNTRTIFGWQEEWGGRGSAPPG